MRFSCATEHKVKALGASDGRGGLCLKPGHTSSIRRIEAGMLSYHADMTLANNPYEMGMGRLVDLDKADFISKAALTLIKERVSQQLVGLKLTALPLSAPMTFWPVLKEGVKVGTVTSAIILQDCKTSLLR